MSDENLTEEIDLETKIAKLLDEHALNKTKKKADEKRRHLSEQDWRKLRVRAKRDLFFFSYSVLGYTRLSVNLHGHLCEHVRFTANNRFREYLLPRAHFKSTVLTISHSLQIVLPYDKKDEEFDDSYDELPWPQGLGTDCRLLIGHETAEGAARFLFSLTNHVLSNPVLQMLFPEIVPSPREQTINKWALELPRTRPHPEPTIDTMGVGAKSQGRHYNYIKLDDVYGDKARDSEAESATTLQWINGIQAFFDVLSKDKIDFIGTRYKLDDVYGHIQERYGDQLVIYRRSVTEVDKHGVEVPIFPEEITLETLAIMKQDRKFYTAQMLNDPEGDDEGFKPEYRRYFYWRDKHYLDLFDFHGRKMPLLPSNSINL